MWIVSLKALMQSHDYKYISVMDFIKLVANHTNDTSDIVIEYLCKFCLVDNDDVRIYIKGFANDYSNEFHLSDLIFKDDKIDDFRCYTMSELEKDNEFLISYFLKDEIFNAKYIKVLNLKTDNDKPQATNSDEVSAPTSTIELGEYQKLLISYELFTPEQIVCLMIDENPASISHNDKYLAHCDRVSTALDANALTPINDKDQIASAQVKSWLARCGLIYKGFNDYVIEEDDPLQKSIDDTTEILSIVYDDNKSKDKEIEQLATEYEELRLEYQALEQRLADKETNASFMMGNPTVKQTDPLNNSQLIKELAASKAQIANLERQLKQANTALADVPADEAELNPKTQTAVTRLLNVLFHKAEMNIEAHKGTTNKNIVNSSISLNAKITEKPVSHWIKQVQQLRIETQKDK